MIQPPFDEKLYILKFASLSRELHKKIYPAERRVFAEQRKIGQGHGVSFYAKLADAHLDLLREHLEGVDRICREVWDAQGNSVTPEFVRTVIRGHISSHIAAGAGSIKGHLQLMARRTRFTDMAAPLDHLALKRGQLESEWSERCEIEAIELEHRAKSKARLGAVGSGYGSEDAAQAKSSQSNWSESLPALIPHQIAKKAFSKRHDLWRDFQDRFMRLAGEEQGRAEVITTAAALRAMNQLLRAHCTYRNHPEGWERGKPDQGMICLLDTPPHGVWNYSNGVSENFRERVRLCVAEAGCALPDYPTGTDAEDFWLHRLYLGLLENNSEQLFAASEEGGMIISVCVASATFCARLQRQALQQAELTDTNGKDRDSEKEIPYKLIDPHATGTAAAKPPIGQNIDELRKESGWSFDQLAKETGIDKKLIGRHVNKGTRPTPRILREYAQAFSRRLSRNITPLDLEK